ncbi:MAG: hypothetical protein H6839_03385 [Planctomycetes bacterium]|nr:hypothetical protein [Planctomycetota bacterium]
MDFHLSEFLDTPDADGWLGGLMDEYARAAVNFCRELEGRPAALPREALVDWLYPSFSRPPLLMTGGMTMLAARFLTYEPQPART